MLIAFGDKRVSLPTMYKPCAIDTLEDRVSSLLKNGGSPKDHLDACMQLQFFPAQWKRCQALMRKAYEELRNNNNGDFETYRLLCDAGIRFFGKCHSRDWTIALFAFEKMKQTKSKLKHQRIVFEYWLMLKRKVKVA